MTLGRWLSGDLAPVSSVQPPLLQHPLAMDRYEHGGHGSATGWVASGHGGGGGGGGHGHEKKAMKNPRTAFSALTLLAFLFFLNVLQSCLQQNMTNDNPNVNLMMMNGAAGGRKKRDSSEGVKGDEGSFWTRYPPSEEDNKYTLVEWKEKETERKPRGADWMSQSLSAIHASQRQREEHWKQQVNGIEREEDSDEEDEPQYQQPVALFEGGFFSTIAQIARHWISKLVRLFSYSAGSYLRSRALMPECHAWAACETKRWSHSMGPTGQRLVHFLSEFLGWSTNNSDGMTKVEVARGKLHQQHSASSSSSLIAGYACQKQAQECVTRDSKRGTEWWPMISPWLA